MATFNGSKHSDTISGTGHADRIFGENGNDILNGGAGDDHIDGGNGSDTLIGGAGNDELDGGNGQDTVILSGRSSDYDFSLRTDGMILVRDLRAGSPDGSDRLISIERVQAADGIFKIVDLISANVAPVAADDQLTLTEDAGASDLTALLLANDRDGDGDALRISSVQAVSAQGATISISATGQVSYDAGSIFAGLESGQTAIDSFTYTVTDEFGLTSTATATLTITGVSHNAAPVAVDDILTVAENAGATDVTATLLANDSDPDGGAFGVTSVQAVSASGAAVSLSADGKVSYDPGAIFAGLETGQTATDSFTYTITDANGLNSTATATVTITGVTQNAAPVAVSDILTLAENAGATDVTAILLANDSDPDGDSITVSAVQAVSSKGATVTLSPNGTVSYNPGQIFNHLEAGQRASDTFTYTVTDARGASSTATATVTITGVSFEPDAFYIVEEDGTSEDMLGSIIETFGFDVVGVQTDGLLGTLVFNQGDAGLVFTADHASSDALGGDHVQWTYFTVLGDQGESAVIGMYIIGRNDDIIAVDDEVAVAEGQTSGNLWSVLVGNDIDPDDSVNTHQIRSVDTTGTLGSVTYDPSTRTVVYSAAGIDLAPGETITDSFTYTVSDSAFGVTDTGTVTVTVTGSGASSLLSAFLADDAAPAYIADLGGFALMQPEQLMIAEMPIG
jgi:VCBS repeat-containing protein